MTIKVGDKLPEATFKTMGEDGPKAITTEEVFKGKRVGLFAVPGAFTPTCSARHLPGFRDQADALKGKGLDAIACVSVNDVFVMDAWGKSQGVGDLYRLYIEAKANNMSFQVAAIPASFRLVSKEPFDPAYMRKLFDVGYEQGRMGSAWSAAPPGLLSPSR